MFSNIVNGDKLKTAQKEKKKAQKPEKPDKSQCSVGVNQDDNGGLIVSISIKSYLNADNPNIPMLKGIKCDLESIKSCIDKLPKS